MTDTSRLSWQLLMVGPGIDRITPDTVSYTHLTLPTKA